MSEQLNTNPRILKARTEGFYVSKGSICNSCGVRDQCKPAALQSVCNEFSALFVFRPPLIGFKDFFNTFRLGEGTFNRFEHKIGTVVTLYEKKKARTLGYAKIVGLAKGPMQAMLDRHAHTNHLSIGKDVSRADAPVWLKAVLERNYKTMFKTADRTDPFSVIFMKRLAEAPAISADAGKAPIAIEVA